MNRKFDSLRTTPWDPSFTWVSTAWDAADRINSFHEDYPQRVVATESILLRLQASPFRGGVQQIFTAALRSIHWYLFQDQVHAGNFRQLNVTVGLHRPPDWELVPKLVDQLEREYLGVLTSVKDLQDWYYDFETIHPFQDGNSRVGGVMVAGFTHARHPEKGWLAPNQ